MDPIKIVALDIDETLGSFGILYSIFTQLSNYPGVTSAIIPELVGPIALWLERSQVFRPGIRRFLKFLLKLKKENKIHYIFLFTNQSAPKDSAFSSIGPFLVACMEFLVGEKCFDKLYMRDPKVKNDSGKDIQRIISDIPYYRFEYENILFVDNLPNIVEYNGYKLYQTEKWSTVYAIGNYNKVFEKFDDIFELINITVDSMDYVLSSIFSNTWKQYNARKPQIDSNTLYIDFELLILEKYITNKFKTIERLNGLKALPLESPFSYGPDQIARLCSQI